MKDQARLTQEPVLGEGAEESRTTTKSMTVTTTVRRGLSSQTADLFQAIAANEIRRRVHMPIMLTSAVVSGLLVAFAVLLGFALLAIPFGVASIFSIYAYYSLKNDIKEIEIGVTTTFGAIVEAQEKKRPTA